MSNYGLPYMGSKSKLARYVLNCLPKAKNIYDLFGGGFSITHCAALLFNKKWSAFHYNEIKPGMSEFIKDAITGKYNYKNFKPPFIGREEFKKSNDQYVRVIWSFGNNCKRYLFNPEIERCKKSLHNAVVFNEFDDYAKKFLGFDKFFFDDIKKRRLALKKVDHSLQLQQLEQLERLERLEQLERLDSISFSSLSYDKVPIKENSIVYCDPPYAGTAKYSAGGFDHGKFYNWCREQSYPVFISEYNMPKDFKVIKVFSHRSTLSSTSNLLRYEKIFANSAGYSLYNKQK